MSSREARQKANLHLKRSTGDYAEFREMCRRFKKRTVVVSEGDSWFAYPPKWLIAGRSSNVISFLKMKEKFNLYQMSRNGDEILDILSGDNKFKLLKTIAENKIDFFLISGGGNDLVGPYDFEFVLQKNEAGQKPSDYIRKDRFDRRMSQISNAYANLIDYCADYSLNPDIKIITHCYGYAIPQDRPAQFVGGLVDVGPWMYPTLKALKIPKDMWRKLVVLMMNRLKTIFRTLQNRSEGRFHFVDSTAVISDKDWIDEIHLTPDGFQRVADLIFAKMKELSGK